jgi:hypothetical protein
VIAPSCVRRIHPPVELQSVPIAVIPPGQSVESATDPSAFPTSANRPHAHQCGGERAANVRPSTAIPIRLADRMPVAMRNLGLEYGYLHPNIHNPQISGLTIVVFATIITYRHPIELGVIANRLIYVN